MSMDEKDKKLFAGDWIFDETKRLAYKLDKQGSLIFNWAEDDVSEEEKLDFAIEALVHLGVDEEKAEEIVATMEPMQ